MTDHIQCLQLYSGTICTSLTIICQFGLLFAWIMDKYSWKCRYGKKWCSKYQRIQTGAACDVRAKCARYLLIYNIEDTALAGYYSWKFNLLTRRSVLDVIHWAVSKLMNNSS